MKNKHNNEDIKDRVSGLNDIITSTHNVRTYMVQAHCPICNGIMKHADRAVMLAVYPPVYTHICDDCGYIDSYHEIYPKIEYEIVD